MQLSLSLDTTDQADRLIWVDYHHYRDGGRFYKESIIQNFLNEWKGKIVEWKKMEFAFGKDWWLSRFHDDHPGLEFQYFGIFDAIWNLHREIFD